MNPMAGQPDGPKFNENYIKLKESRCHCKWWQGSAITIIYFA